jgi:hypothetical protein
MALISVTRLRVRSFIYLPQFFWHTFKSIRQAERSSGFLGGRLLVNAKNVFWTMTAWKDQAAMNAYRTGGAHRRAMPKLLNWCNEAANRALDPGILRNPFLAGGTSTNDRRRETVQSKSSVARSAVESHQSPGTESHRANT